MPATNPLPLLRRIGLAEAVSFLVLLGIGMPAKYVAGKPEVVKLLGWIHGLLFIAFCAALLRTLLLARWPLPRAAGVFVAALVPFGPFVIDRRMLAWEREHTGRAE